MYRTPPDCQGLNGVAKDKEYTSHLWFAQAFYSWSASPDIAENTCANPQFFSSQPVSCVHSF